MVNISVNRLLFLSVLSFFPYSALVKGNISIEFKQAVTRYVKHTENQCLNSSIRYTDENVFYKKELRYLFSNYGKISSIALLSRLRSAHQAMVKNESHQESDVYKRYEQISSSLLLICAQVFCNDVRDQILDALQEIDSLIVYWQYQHNHPISYFFGKSPIKWVSGKKQDKEIVYNLRKLESKQKELYTLLGALTGHMHLFTEASTDYNNCYRWIEELFVMLTCIEVSHNYNLDGTQFDFISAELELKMRRVSSLKHEFLLSLGHTKKPNHFVRHWIAYTTLVAAIGCLVRYHYNNGDAVPKAFERAFIFAQSVGVSVVIDPLIDLRDVCFGRDSKSAVKEIEDRIVIIEKYANGVKSNVAAIMAKNQQSLREYIVELLERCLTTMVNEWTISPLINQVEKEEIIVEVRAGNLTKLNKLCENTKLGGVTGSLYRLEYIKDEETVRVLCAIDEVLTILKDYPQLIDNYIVPLIKEIGFFSTDIGKIVGDFVKNNFWTAKLAAFTPLAAACMGTVKTYQWITKKNYAPIRVALADVNALLIESVAQLDDHDYGKLVYLIGKLRQKAKSLKDALSSEFLLDVAKLESKRYSAQTKRDIVENMFNKYAFLGRVVA
jgi:hypothetical protein